MEHLDASAQAKQVERVGARLLAERQRQGIELESIAATTYIPLRLLKALEAGRQEVLPEPVFIQGFIRRYADALGLDGTAIAREFPVNLSPVPVASGPQPLTEASPAHPKATAEPSHWPPDASTEAALSRPQQALKWPVLPWGPIAGAIGLGVLALVAATAFKPGPDSAQRTVPVSSIVPAPAPAAKASPALKPTVAIKMTVTEESWVEVMVDGQSAYAGTLTPGTTRTWTGKKQVAVTAGNAGGVSISDNQGAMKVLGAPGEVKTRTFPPNRS